MDQETMNCGLNQCLRPAGRRRGWLLLAAGTSLFWLLACLFTGSGIVSRVFGQASAPTDYLSWQVERGRVDAQIQAWDLLHLLTRIAEITGWQIYLEPETEHTVSVKFRDLEVSEALGRLLGGINYALLPQPRTAPKLFVFRTSVQEATQRVRPPAGKTNFTLKSGLIPNELIVTLKPGSKTSIEELARRLGAKVVGRSDDLKAYRLQFTDEEATKTARALLESDSDVNAVDANYAIPRPERAQALAMGASPPLNLKPKNPPDPNRLVIGLIDTAVQSQATRIKDFLLPGLTVAGEAAPVVNEPTHGTSMAETILRGLSVASQATEGTSTRILPVDVYGSQESTSTYEVATGIYTAVKNGATLINLSLGGDNESAFLHEVIQEAHKQGVMLVAAAGNEPTTNPVYPAAYPEVLATTAGDKSGQIAPYANHGSFVGAVAPGGSVVYFNNQAFLISGTSASTAYVTGFAAGLTANTQKSLAEVEAEIRRNFSPPNQPIP